jgi:CubicO group peptidase (beta-lactamase class C family)
MHIPKWFFRGLAALLLFVIQPYISLFAQTINAHSVLADSILKEFKLPAIGYAVISSGEYFELEVLGVKQLGTNRAATTQDRFRIGSNSKAITALLAAVMIQNGEINWETKFFDLFPKWKPQSNEAYHDLTLADLLSFRNWLPMYSYNWSKPRPRQIMGDAVEQRYNFGKWALRQKPVYLGEEFNRSNLSFVAAGLMLEKASNKTFELLLEDLEIQMDIRFRMGQPNHSDSLAIWGHDARLNPEPPGENVKLNWLAAAGNIQLTLPDFARFLQYHLAGLRGECAWLPKETFEKILFGRPEFAFGWFWEINENGDRVAHNIGNPGSFLSRVLINPTRDRAYIVVTNCMTESSYEGTQLLMNRLQQ